MHIQPGESLPSLGRAVWGREEEMRVLLRITPSLLPTLLKSRALRDVQPRMGARLTSVGSVIQSFAVRECTPMMDRLSGQTTCALDLALQPWPNFPLFCDWVF